MPTSILIISKSTVQNNSFALTNYVFDHWNTLPNNSGTSAVGGDKFNIHSNTTFNRDMGAGRERPGRPARMRSRIRSSTALHMTRTVETQPACRQTAISIRKTTAHLCSLRRFRHGAATTSWAGMRLRRLLYPHITASGIKTYTMGGE